MKNTKAGNEINARLCKRQIAGRVRLVICDRHALEVIDLERIARIKDRQLLDPLDDWQEFITICTAEPKACLKVLSPRYEKPSCLFNAWYP